MKARFLAAIIVVLMITVGCSARKLVTPGNQTGRVFSKKITKTIDAQYLIYLPEDYDDNTDKLPLMFFLHGSGERGTDLDLVKVHGPPKLIANGHQFPFIVVSPQCPADEWWDIDYLDAIFDEVTTSYRVDEKRIYLTGLSMGGFGTWDWAAEYPGRFAAIAPICGGGEPFSARLLNDIPIWVFHGEKDKVVPIKRS